jgi:hypothetical protein
VALSMEKWFWLWRDQGSGRTAQGPREGSNAGIGRRRGVMDRSWQNMACGYFLFLHFCSDDAGSGCGRIFWLVGSREWQEDDVPPGNNHL